MHATISKDDYLDVLRHFAAGVTLVTTHDGARRHGMTVTAFASISAEPPIVAVALDHGCTMHSLLAEDPASFAVNLLAAEQRALSDRFAFEKDADRFLEGAWDQAPHGAPVLTDAVAWLDCVVVGRHAVGSHTVHLGEVRASRVPRPDCEPLVYWNRGYHGLASV